MNIFLDCFDNVHLLLQGKNEGMFDDVNKWNIVYSIMPRWSQSKQPRRHPRFSKPQLHYSSLNFDSFTFVDNFTNTKITMSEARKQYPLQRRASQQKNNCEAQKELNNLNECISTLKSTKLFQLDSLRHKIFKSIHNNTIETNDEENLKQTKR